jgi:succinate dehydrogenase / fumarate reductase iron-sulfur subunit
MQATFKILRFDPERDEVPRFQTFPYACDDARSVLDALIEIRDEQDPSLAFRYSCREAVCGSCAMVINGRFELACRTLLNRLGTETIAIEPLPNLEILRDLVVDLEPFWAALRLIEPFVCSEGEHPAQGHRIEERAMEAIGPYVNCVLCGCCYSARPVVGRAEGYSGPMALAKLYRFVRDPRDRRPFANWSRLSSDGGVWGCHTIFRCNEACPKQVDPAYGIASLRRKLVFENVKRILRFKAK